MILCPFGDFRRYHSINARFSTLSSFVESTDLKEVPKGRHDILGDELYVIASPEAATRTEAMLEAHRRYIDVHLVLEGIEQMGWSPIGSVQVEDAPFDIENDFVCFRDAPQNVYSVTPGSLAVFFPEDAHVPLLGSGNLVHKCIFKVLV